MPIPQKTPFAHGRGSAERVSLFPCDWRWRVRPRRRLTIHRPVPRSISCSLRRETVPQDPISHMQEVRARCPIAISANEGLWTPAEAYRQITSRTADVYCFSPYFTGSLAQFQRLCWLAHFEGFHICRHTHGEFGWPPAKLTAVVLASNLSQSRAKLSLVPHEQMLTLALLSVPFEVFPRIG